MDLDATLELLARDPSAPVDVAAVALHLARDEYPHLDPDGYLAEFDGMAHEVRPYLSGRLEAKVAGLCRYLFHEVGFHGNPDNYYDPRNSYLNEVMDRHLGIPITLSVVAMAVGGRAGLRIEGVGLPGHFVAAAIQGQRVVLFDPYNGGQQLDADACEELIRASTGVPLPVTPDVLLPAEPGAIVLRILTNLKACYLKCGDYRRAARVIGRLRQLAPDDVSQRRDLGVCLLNSGQPGRAIDHLAAYLHRAGGASDADAVRDHLQKAKCEVARWN